MTTIILMIIGIMIAAMAALMLAFFGGDAFNTGSIGAQSSSLLNAGENVLAASDLRRAEIGSIAGSLPDLISGGHLSERPSFTGAKSQDAWRTVVLKDGTDGLAYVATDVSDPLCERIQQDVRDSKTKAGPTVNARMGCYRPEGGTNTFYTVLDVGRGASKPNSVGSFDWDGLGNSPFRYAPQGVPGMRFVGGAGITSVGPAWGFPSSPDGGNAAFMQDAGAIGIDVNGLVPGAIYEVQFYIAARERVVFDVDTDGSDDLMLSYGGINIGTWHPTSRNFVKETSMRFRALAGVNEIVFYAEPQGKDQSTGIDGVKVVRVS